jgi:uncharacterized protein (DUF2147 family)
MSTNRCCSLLTRSAALTLFLIALPGIACAFDPYGTWMRPSTGTQVSFYDCGGKLCAKIVAVKDERRKSKIGDHDWSYQVRGQSMERGSVERG